MDENTSIDQKSRETIDERIRQEKEEVLVSLKAIPIVYVASKKAGISPATYYRWQKEDKEFAKKAKHAQREGEIHLRERALSVVIKYGTDGNDWRAAFTLVRYLDRNLSDDNEKPPIDISTILSNPQALNALSEILKIASINLTEKEKTNE